mmetsp:Transcript_17340/g.42132  ORF Transcript_17340/g.42132 Transcript_17340/m.42132 type:complete len:702 (-) Transcript_17340:1825-3930(-)|eukprot:CAMPEP_0113468254 /NCGR_PEP_ID=MMETSP0014_2-20120614/15255_1 /TAXON_ID=2857 /ORGANISM="Nitzschia sp." /LENGTH=701 /DNA_ID=CAMNT_0000360627 /DNA_START=61 /DNA_END=2166 /DNA_ORIENTATION=+ /assembly_acc=CAM_ASM_000159
MAEAFDLVAAGGSGGGGMPSSSSFGRGGGRSSSHADSLLVHKDRQTYVWSKVEIQQTAANEDEDEDDDDDAVDEGYHHQTGVDVNEDDNVDGDGHRGRHGRDDDDNNNNLSEEAVEEGEILDHNIEHRHQDGRQNHHHHHHRHPRVPPPRSGAASVVLNSKLYLYGGYGGGTGRLDDFWMFDLKEKRWNEVDVVSDEKPGCRENNGVVISDSNRSFIMFGGYNGTIWLNDLWKFDSDPQPKWTCLQAATHEVDGGGGGGQNNPAELLQRPCARFGYVSVVYRDKFVLWGGFDGSRWLNDCFEFSMETSSWTRIQQKGSIPSVRSCPAWSQRDGALYIHGGYDGLERKDDFYCCDLRTYTWRRVADMGVRPSSRYFHSSVLYGNKLFVYGGYSGTSRLNDLWAFDFDNNIWSEVYSRGQAPSGRSSLVAQVYENYLYVFGGYDGNSVMNDMFRCRLASIEVPPSSLVNDFKVLINDDEMSDVKFLVNGEIFHAHRCILAVRSQYFRAMLFNQWRESTSNEGIVLTDVSSEVFLKILEYLYTDTVHDLPWRLGIELMMAAELFMLDRLKGICEDVIRSEITVENVVGVLMASHQHNATGLKQIALEVIVQNMTNPTIQAGLQSLESEGKLLIEIIKLQSLQPASSSSSSPSPLRVERGNGSPIRRPPAQPMTMASQPMDQFYAGRRGGNHPNPFGRHNMDGRG